VSCWIRPATRSACATGASRYRRCCQSGWTEPGNKTSPLTLDTPARRPVRPVLPSEAAAPGADPAAIGPRQKPADRWVALPAVPGLLYLAAVTGTGKGRIAAGNLASLRKDRWDPDSSLGQ
jgi:hypothetical protein